MMKIAVVGTRGFPGVQGGVERHCEELYTRLAQKGCDITVFTREPYVTFAHGTYKDVTLIPVSCPGTKYFEAFIHTLKCVLKARKLKPDILHIHAIGPSLFAPLGRILGMKVAVTNHGPDYRREKWHLFGKLFLRLSEWIGIMFANQIIAVSENTADVLRRKHKSKVTAIPNGAGIPLVLESADILKKYGLQKRKYILSVGRLVPEKGFDTLIDAFSRTEFEMWNLVIVGRADHEDKYSTALQKKAAGKKGVILTGVLTGRPLNELYSHAGLFVLPSYYEGQSIVLLEAMSYGLSCIVSDIHANRGPDISEDRYFKAGDVRALNAKIREFIDRPLEEAERNKQIDITRKKYDWDKIALETLKTYEKINL